MKVAILCGGYGTRIRDVADNIPKPMILIGDKPILWHIMKYYAEYGIKQFVLCLGYRSNVIKEFFLNYEANTNDFTITLGKEKKIQYHNEHPESDWQITLAETGLNSMTGARLKRVQRHLLNEDNFMLTYGDGVGDIDIHRLMEFHKKHGKILTVTGVRPPGRFGELMNDEEGRVYEFNEKPQASGGRISGGFFVCRKEIFNYLGDNESLIFEQEPMRQLVKDGQLMVYEHDGFWQPMDTHREYLLLNDLYSKGEAPWVVW
ncbi:MAG TPA: glucose-1-phosphate cytidylyltransferase [Syntrophorhabdaceae bacterium]|nr:glucose-1-phosphate cytidylyltransferase [Syntrophorhabdaceae bacterium]